MMNGTERALYKQGYDDAMSAIVATSTNAVNLAGYTYDAGYERGYAEGMAHGADAAYERIIARMNAADDDTPISPTEELTHWRDEVHAAQRELAIRRDVYVRMNQILAAVTYANIGAAARHLITNSTHEALDEVVNAVDAVNEIIHCAPAGARMEDLQTVQQAETKGV